MLSQVDLHCSRSSSIHERRLALRELAVQLRLLEAVRSVAQLRVQLRKIWQNLLQRCEVFRMPSVLDRAQTQPAQRQWKGNALLQLLLNNANDPHIDINLL